MKFYGRNSILALRSIMLLLFVLSYEVHSLKMRTNQFFEYDQNNKVRPDTTRSVGSGAGRNLMEEEKLTNYFSKFRFQNTGQANPIPEEEKNEFLMNSHILDKKPPASPEDKEEEVWPASANAGTEFSWGFLYWSFFNYKAKNAISGHQSYWLSKRNVQNDHWEAVFGQPMKVDTIQIHWRLPPKRFRVYFKSDESADYIPVTETYSKTAFVSSEGQIANQEAVSPYNAIVFDKPLFAKRIRISLSEPLKKKSFSIFSVKFFHRKSVILVKNELVEPCKHMCWFVNSDKPRPELSIEAYPCVSSVAMSSNQELFVYENDRSVRHFNSNLCVGFNQVGELVLKNCPRFNPAFTIQLHGDKTLFFTGYNDQCIYIEDSKKTSPNYISKDTDVIITSQADNQSYKKENIKMDGEQFWHSAPGQKKVTLQFLFGKIKSGPLTGQYESKKIDTIKIEWIREPKKFMVYTWRPGYSWTLRGVYDNFKEKKSEIQMVGQEAAAVMIVLDKSHKYPDLGGKPAFAMKEIYIGISSMKVKTTQCGAKINKFKIFDFDQQEYKKIEQTKPYNEIMQKVSVSFEKEINIYKNLKIMFKYIEKAKEKAQDFLNKLNTVKNAVGSATIKTLKNYKNDSLGKINNAQMQKHITNKKETSFQSATTRQYSGTLKMGTKQLPAEDCLQIKKIRKTVLSGFYYIKPECAPKPIRVFCDFALYADAVDIYIFNNYADEPNPDLTYLGIKSYRDVRYQCAKVGLVPIELQNKDMVQRIFQLLIAIGYDLSKPIAIPLGYDYSCKNKKCNRMINSLNDPGSPPIMTFFKDPFKNTKNLTKPGPFAGLGFSHAPLMITFDPSSTVISGLVCSTNHFKTDANDNTVKTISCELNAASNGDLFQQGADILVKCPASCQQSKAPVFGSGVYHAASAVCVAALHSGILKISGGKVYVRLQKGLAKYQGSSANGVKSLDRANDGQAGFAINKYVPKCPINQFPDKKAEVEMEKENSFLEMKNFEENFVKAQNPSNFKFDPAELEGVDIEELNKAGLKVSEADLNSEGSRLQNMYLNNHQNFKFAQMESENGAYQLPSPGDPSQLANNAAGLANNALGAAAGAANSLPGANNNNPTPSTIGSDNTNLGGLQAPTDPAKPSDPGLPQASGVPGQTAGPGAQSGNPTTPIDPTNSPFIGARGNGNGNGIGGFNPGMKVPGLPQVPTSPDPSSGGIGGGIGGGNTPGIPQPPPSGPNAAPPQPQVQPESENDKPPEDGKRCLPVTDDGVIEMKEIRKTADWDFLKELRKKNEAVTKEISNFKKEIAWAAEGASAEGQQTSKLSNGAITVLYHAVASFKNKVQAQMRALDEQAQARVQRTKKITQKWSAELDKLTETDPGALDYSVSEEKLFENIFEISDVKCDFKSNWRVHTKDVKGRSKAMGNTSRIFSANQPAASVIALARKNFYDFSADVDILVKASGKAGVVFRMVDQFNYYALLIDKKQGYKALIKVMNGNTTVLKKVKDGGILVNDWHSVNIRATTGNLRVYIYDNEMTDKASSEKVLEATDYSFPRGTVGLFVNDMQGFFFDKLSVKPLPCWTPWTPMQDIEISTSNSSIIIEDFRVSITEKFEMVEIIEEKDGPSVWASNADDKPGFFVGITQSSLVYDASVHRRAAFMVYKRKQFSNGIYDVCFIPQTPDGMVSIIFKYVNERSPTGENNEKFYSFDLIHSATNPQLVLRRFNLGVIKEIKAVNVKPPELTVLGYDVNKKHCVSIESVANKMSISLSINDGKFINVMNVKEDAIKVGTIGFGTYKTVCTFTKVQVLPPRIRLTEADKNYILSHEMRKLPMPDVMAIFKASSRLSKRIIRSFKSSSSMTSIMSRAASVGSSMGLDLSESSSEMSIKYTSAKTEDQTKNMSSGWKVCVTSRTKNERDNYCTRTFNNKNSINSCQVSFCDTCCNTNVFSGHKNALHLCKKTCYRSSLAENSNDEYVNTCINSENPVQNIYTYCQEKMKDYDESVMRYCKLDYCNLCCVTMDPMKKKNFSVDNMKKCFKDCSNKFNNDGILRG